MADRTLSAAFHSLLPPRQQPQSQSQPPPPQQHRQFVTADGVRLAADTFGEPGSPAVILMHGGGQTRHSWSGVVGPLAAAGYFVVNYDARGHGDSGWSADGVYNYPLRAADLRSIVGELRGPCALLGASMGGITALQAV